MLDYQKLLFVFLLSLTTQVIVYIFVTFLSKKGIKTNYFAIQKIHEGEVPRIGGLLFLSSFLINTIQSTCFSKIASTNVCAI